MEKEKGGVEGRGESMIEKVKCSFIYFLHLLESQKQLL